ncbi:MAG TPA: homoaconitase [Terriglobales bacterium]|nr:homoaconitase [Terriglobales bacterium]
MAQTVVEKIAQAHLAEGPERPLRAGDFVSIRPHHIMTHDNTSAVMKKFQGIGAKKLHSTRQPVLALDHDIQNQSEDNQKKYRAIEAFAKQYGVDFYPAGSGIGHQIMVEKGYVVPGSFVVASDSHSNMYGALAAVGTPVVRTDAAAVWATGEFWWQIPRSVQVVLEGRLPAGATGKDVIIALCGLYNHDEALNAAVEFAGPGVASLSMDARFTISNMSTEWGPLVGWFPCDQVTLAYLQRVHDDLASQGIERFTAQDLERWRNNPPQADPGASYAARITLNLDEVTPHVSGPDTVQVMTALAEIEQKKVGIQKAYLLSCVNSRLEDLEAAARVVKGKKVAAGVTFYLGAASRWVQEEAERSGAWQALLNAGAIPLPAGCGPCIGLGVGLLEPGEVGISATNRNFKGRMGSRDARCYLASPEVVAASAVAGYISSVEGVRGDGASPRLTGAEPRSHTSMQSHTITRQYKELVTATGGSEQVEILSGFPERLRGRLIFLAADNINTDQIYGKDYTYRDDMTPEMMAKVIMENYDPQLAGQARAGDIFVGGYNFGTGSSREQAVTSLQARGIPMVVAASFSQTYLRNAFNNGFLCIESPQLVLRLREQFTSQLKAGDKTIMPGEELEVDFTSGVITYRGDKFHFPPLGSVPQSLVVAKGVENLVARKLGLKN